MAGEPILNLGDLMFLATGGGGGSPEQINWCKKALVAGAAGGTEVAGAKASLWLRDGFPGAATAVPTTAVVVNNATAGSFMQATSAAGAKKRLLSIVASSQVTGTLGLYDRLGQHGGLDGTGAGAQTTNLPTAALTRFTSGVGVQAWLEVWTQIGATSRTFTASYTNTVPTSGQTSIATSIGNAGFREAQRLLIMPIAAGDKGVTALASVTLSASTGTAGNFGVTLAYPLVTLPMPVVGAGFNWSGLMYAGGPLSLGVAADSCLALWFAPNATTAAELQGQSFFMEK